MGRWKKMQKNIHPFVEMTIGRRMPKETCRPLAPLLAEFWGKRRSKQSGWRKSPLKTGFYSTGSTWPAIRSNYNRRFNHEHIYILELTHASHWSQLRTLVNNSGFKHYFYLHFSSELVLETLFFTVDIVFRKIIVLHCPKQTIFILNNLLCGGQVHSCCFPNTSS